MSVIDRISSLFIFRWIIYVASLSFMGVGLSSDRKHISIPYLTAREQNNSPCALGMTISDSDNFFLWMSHSFGGLS